ncbi:MAG: MauE/DoxX family redox-associated membrane protein, partial [Solirubrobacteraceae bacterium]
WVLVLVLLGAGLAKVGDREQFSDVIKRYAIVPAHYAATLAASLPWVEIAVAVALAVGLAPAASGWCASVLLLGFGYAVGVNLARGRRFDCGCGSSTSMQIGWSLLVRNLVLAAVGAAVALGPTGLTVSAGSLGGGRVHPAAQALLPVPLTVICIFGLIRCLQSFAAGRIARADGSREAAA